MSSFNKCFDEKHGFDRKLDTRIYRLLGIYIEDIYPYVGDLELKIPYNTKKKREMLSIIDNAKWDKEKREKLYKCSLIKEKLIKELMKNKNIMFHKSYNHYEKKMMNGLNDKVFFKKMVLINNKDYKKLKRKKYGLRLCILLLLFLTLLIIPILDLSIGNLLMVLLTLLEKGASAGMGDPMANPAGIILIIGIFYYYKNVVKHKKIKSLEAFNEW
ncbi:Plasmodium exported protein (Pm-fam-a like), unknown function [Plasmodium malariae]|uniref:Uncharacterized protein n=1 Tax=Plasmodium malariae TaxID=5858 RepID=A0A1A8WQE6_PLAMA|nr:Plasmodium exported protein (Pm-fam-a like), unknown function [Plasmodium malariae]